MIFDTKESERILASILGQPSAEERKLYNELDQLRGSLLKVDATSRQRRLQSLRSIVVIKIPDEAKP